MWKALLPSLVLISMSACDDGSGAGPVAEYDADYRAENPYTDLDVRRDGLAVATRLFAATQAEGRPTVVLLHGYPDSQHLYDRVIPELRRTRDVVSFDFVGWGRSDKPDPATYVYDSASWRKDLEAVLAAVGDNQYVLVVHDAGGWPGIDWALDNPARTAALVILNTVYHPVDAARPPEGLAQFVGNSEARNQLAALMQSDDNLWIQGDAERGIVGYRTQLDRFMNDEAAQAELLPVLEAESFAMRPAFMELASVLPEEVAARVPSIPRMMAFDRPVSVVFGADDPYLNLDVAADFARLFPQSTRVDIAAANHYVQVDAPAEVATSILAADR